MLREFEYGIKRSFNGDTGKDYSVDLRGVEDNPKEDILDDNIPVKPTVLRTIFDHIYCKIDQLVQQQVREVQEKNLNVKSILLVGGFGENRYIHQQLEATYKSQNIRVLQVDGAWSSICRGACMWGLEQDVYIRRGQNGERGDSTIGRPNGTITARISRYSYGIPIMEPFDPVRHVWRDRFQDPATGNIMANNQMRWLLRRGEMHEIGATMDIGVKEAVNGIGWRSKGNRPFHQRLYYSDQAVASSRKDDSVRQLCSVIFTVPEKDIRQAAKSYKSPVGSGKWRDTYFDMIVRLRSGVLDFIVCQKGVVVGQTEVSYSDIE
ncbi:putative hsp70 family chaperone protein [Rosellinia necatrix]|uniref:Putative hsp70 family chaperone protein n=1 Tax=Rosellinia necatrix TaxID=77044 RepID=A0A1S8AA07_ROSNE|nr:putative hsp70 family chaperone protein [Rosellinia necatrix]